MTEQMQDDPPIYATAERSGFTVWDDATGRIVSSGHCPPEMIAIQSGLGQSYIDEAYEEGDYWFLGGVLTPRPQMVEINPAQVAGVRVDMPGVLDGARVTLTDAYKVQNEWIYDSSDPLILLDAGAYHIRVTQDFPCHSAEQWVEVSNA